MRGKKTGRGGKRSPNSLSPSYSGILKGYPVGHHVGSLSKEKLRREFCREGFDSVSSLGRSEVAGSAGNCLLVVTAQALDPSISHSSALGFQEYTMRQLHLQGSVSRKRIVGFTWPHHIRPLLQVFLGEPGVQCEPASGWGLYQCIQSQCLPRPRMKCPH